MFLGMIGRFRINKRWNKNKRIKLFSSVNGNSGQCLNVNLQTIHLFNHKFQNLTSRETLTKQKKQAEAAAARKRKAGLGGGTCNKKVFEDLERRADEEAARSVIVQCMLTRFDHGDENMYW